jgi:hypothetical protein
MTIASLLGFSFLSFLLLLAGLFVGQHRVWSAGADPTIAWFCSAVAIALIVVGATSLLCQTTPGRIPRRSSLLVWITVVVLVGAGVCIDGWSSRATFGFRVSIAEWLGFAALLFVLFEVPRAAANPPAA